MRANMAKDKLLIIGAGFLGQHLFVHFKNKYQTTILNNPEVDITNVLSLESCIKTEKPTIIINAAAFTNVDEAEIPSKQEIVFDINVRGPLNIASLAEKYHFKLVHISTGMIFDGSGKNGSGFTEEDQPNPTCYYSWTKAWCDNALLLNSKSVLITRIHMPVSAESNLKNLLYRIINYDKAYTGKNTITVVNDYLHALDRLIALKASGIYHIVNSGKISAFDIIKMMQKHEIIDKNIKIKKIDRSKMDLIFKQQGKAIRPDSILSNAKLRKLGIKMPTINDSLQKCIVELKEKLDGSHTN
jgi:dTDP-4-dehydrorhamnose reductase